MSSITTLTALEIEEVSGGSWLGNGLIQFTYLANSFLNTPLISSVGKTMSFFGAGPLHAIPDFGGYVVSKAAIGLGVALGGTDTGGTLHFEKEMAEGDYNFSLFGM